jgi:hypothetical protein
MLLSRKWKVWCQINQLDCLLAGLSPEALQVEQLGGIAQQDLLRHLLILQPIDSSVHHLCAGPGGLRDVRHAQGREERVIRAEHDAVGAHLGNQGLQGRSAVGDRVEVHLLQVGGGVVVQAVGDGWAFVCV